MTERIKCPDCGELFDCENELLGTRLKCGVCNFEFVAQPYVDVNNYAPLQENPTKMYAGFWKRVGATIVDVVVLGVIGALMCDLMFEYISGLGPYGFIIGAIISGLYYVVLLGERGKGQTPGKRALGIRVLAENGGYAKSEKLVFRFLIYNVFFLGNMIAVLFYNSNSTTAISMVSYLSVINIAMYIIIFGTILFHPQKRGLHDLFAGTYVVNVNYENKFATNEFQEIENRFGINEKASKAYGKAVLSAIVIMILFSSFPLFVSMKISKSTGASLKTMSDARSKMQEDAGIIISGINVTTSKNATYMTVTIISGEKYEDLTAEVDRINQIKSGYPEFSRLPLVINIVQVADVGIFRLTRQYNHLVENVKRY